MTRKKRNEPSHGRASDKSDMLGKSSKPARPASDRKSQLYNYLIGLALVVFAAVKGVGMVQESRQRELPLTRSDLTLEEIPFDGATSYDYLTQLCNIGPRPSGSDGMRRQQTLLQQHFKQCGADVIRQEFAMQDPRDGQPIPLVNLIASWKPDRPERIMFCAHYDTLPLPLLDPVDPQGRFVGANDGASGVALLMQFGTEMPELLDTKQTRFGVDFVMFDAEEYMFQPDGRFFIGSEYFAEQYAAGKSPVPGKYHAAILLDMVGDADLQLYQESNSRWWKDSRWIVDSVWSTAARLGVHEFISKKKYEIRDDHLMLHNVGKIPAIDIIDFDYPAWHTRDDTPEQCSALSLAKVGWVIREWLIEQR